MANPVEGSKDHPVQLDPWQKVVKVQWDNDVALLEITRDVRTFYSVTSIDPTDPVIDYSIVDNKTIDPDYYLPFDIILIPIRQVVDSVVVAIAIDNTWWAYQGGGSIIPGIATAIGDPPPNPFFDAAVANLTATYGSGPNDSGEGVNTVDPIVFNVTREDGSLARYVRGFTTTSGPFQYALFYTVRSFPPNIANIVKETTFINFTNKHEKTLKIVNNARASDAYTNQFKLSLYSTDTKFAINVDDQTITPDKSAKKTFTSTAQSSQVGDIIHFNKNGFVKAV